MGGRWEEERGGRGIRNQNHGVLFPIGKCFTLLQHRSCSSDPETAVCGEAGERTAVPPGEEELVAFPSRQLPKVEGELVGEEPTLGGPAGMPYIALLASCTHEGGGAILGASRELGRSRLSPTTRASPSSPQRGRGPDKRVGEPLVTPYLISLPRTKFTTSWLDLTSHTPSHASTRNSSPSCI